MRRSDAEGEFSDFVRVSSRGLLRTAWLLTGDYASAEDLVQASLAHTWVRWGRLRSPAAAESYVRRVMVRTFLRWKQRRWSGEIAVEVVPDVALPGADADVLLVRHALVAAIRELPARQRAVIVLRYFDDLSEAATAQVLGCSVGTVKSQSARALQALRATSGLATVVFGENV